MRGEILRPSMDLRSLPDEGRASLKDGRNLGLELAEPFAGPCNQRISFSWITGKGECAMEQTP